MDIVVEDLGHGTQLAAYQLVRCAVFSASADNTHTYMAERRLWVYPGPDEAEASPRRPKRERQLRHKLQPSRPKLRALKEKIKLCCICLVDVRGHVASPVPGTVLDVRPRADFRRAKAVSYAVRGARIEHDTRGDSLSDMECIEEARRATIRIGGRRR